MFETAYESNEATAILAGDSLQVLAFECLAASVGTAEDAAARLRQIALLATASGTAGMAGGQAMDLAAEGTVLTVPEIERMHLLKTGALIQVSMLLPACRARGLSPEHYRELAAVGSDVGLAFQILDDLNRRLGPILSQVQAGIDSLRPRGPAAASMASRNGEPRDREPLPADDQEEEE